MKKTRESGATVVRLILDWRGVAPAQPPPGFNPANPEDAAYNWSGPDRQVRLATEAGLRPVLDLFGAPLWAQGTPPNLRSADAPFRPNANQLGMFARAAALRYSGRMGLPKVRYWQLWNEPNLIFFLRPQRVGGRDTAAPMYRSMLNHFSTAVHSVDKENMVVAGATAPFTSRTGNKAQWGNAPLAFLRDLLCLNRNLKAECRERAKFDIWAHHPYTSGGPYHHARLRDDISLGDLPEMSAVLRAGRRLGRIASNRPSGFWVTEFSWDTRPPDPKAVPIRLQARWVAEALFQMWRNGVSLVTWYTLQDRPRPSQYQSGLFFYSSSLLHARAKPAYTAFRFPFVAYRRGPKTYIWGRTPKSDDARVVVSYRGSRGWHRLTSVRANRDGIFSQTLRVPLRRQFLRAETGKELSLPFSLRSPKDHFYDPFGS
jgi:hypothetical protein